MKKWMIAICLMPALSLAAPSKPGGRLKTIQSIKGSTTSLEGLSLYGSYDLADTMDYEGSNNGQSINGTMNGEKAFGLGGKYLLTQLDNGIGIEGGGSFEMGRSFNNYKQDGQTVQFQSKPEVQFWTVYLQGVAMLTEQFGIYGGGNFNFPQVKNVKDGNFKGKLGYQIGATYQLTYNVAGDLEYRTLNMSGSSKADDGSTVNYDNVRNQGFTLRARYVF